MSRATYSEEEQFPGQFALWEANLDRAMSGRRGQAALRDLHDALLAMPRKRLISRRLAADGDVCTVGAILLIREARRSGDMAVAQAKLEAMVTTPPPDEADEWDDYLAGDETLALAEKADIPRILAWHLEAENDDYDYGLGDLTPEARYERVLRNVEARLAVPA